MGINAQHRADSKPFSDESSHFHIAITRVCANYQTLSTVGSQSGSLPFQISANTVHSSIDVLTSTDSEVDL